MAWMRQALASIRIACASQHFVANEFLASGWATGMRMGPFPADPWGTNQPHRRPEVRLSRTRQYLTTL
jgi:hypothetical protein